MYRRNNNMRRQRLEVMRRNSTRRKSLKVFRRNRMFRRNKTRRSSLKVAPLHHAQWVMAQQDPYKGILAYADKSGSGFYLGPEAPGERPGEQLRFGSPQNALLVLGPPREGKTTGLVIPIVLSCPGPVVTTSTKLDVFNATAMARALRGTVWVYDPMGTDDIPAGARRLQWSPVAGAERWDTALKQASIMVNTSHPAKGVENSDHWERRGGKLLAALLHLAARKGRSIRHIKEWIAKRDPHELLGLAEARVEGVEAMMRSPVVGTNCLQILMGVSRTAEEEASGVWNTCEQILDAYYFDASESSCDPPYNFDPQAFVTSSDTIYITSGSLEQKLVAPLVVGLLNSIVEATYATNRRGSLAQPVNFVLDEAANIAPIPTLPQLASEGGGQGLQVAAFFQDFSQTQKHWGEDAKGFWTNFGEKVALPGIAHRESVELISLLIGDYDRLMVSTSENDGGGRLGGTSYGRSYSTVRERILPESAVSAGPGPGQAWHMNKRILPHTVESVFLTPWFWAPPWPAVVASALHQYRGAELPVPPLDPGELLRRGWSREFCERFERDRAQLGSGGLPRGLPPAPSAVRAWYSLSLPDPLIIERDAAAKRAVSEDPGATPLPPDIDEPEPDVVPASVTAEELRAEALAGAAEHPGWSAEDKEDDLASL